MDSKNLLKGTMVYSIKYSDAKMGSLIFLPITRLLTKKVGIVGTLSPIGVRCLV